jgi:hypothetical protein
MSTGCHRSRTGERQNKIDGETQNLLQDAQLPRAAQNNYLCHVEVFVGIIVYSTIDNILICHHCVRVIVAAITVVVPIVVAVVVVVGTSAISSTTSTIYIVVIYVVGIVF